jgi:ribonuclease HI
MPDKIQSIHTDGACSGNPGPGGWGIVASYTDGLICELGGAEGQTTNNRMEMQAAIAALKFLAESGQTEPIILYTDSEYLINGATKWIKSWKKKGWKTAQGKPVLNQDLWETIDELNSKRVEWQYVRGHTGNWGNERCDAIARAFANGKTPSLQQPAKPDTFVSKITKPPLNNTIKSSCPSSEQSSQDFDMVDSTFPLSTDALENLPRETRVAQLRNLIDTLHIADEIAAKGYLIASSELADLMDINASAVTSRGDNWGWRNWLVSRVRREGNQILWQLERVDQVKDAESGE